MPDPERPAVSLEELQTAEDRRERQAGDYLRWQDRLLVALALATGLVLAVTCLNGIAELAAVVVLVLVPLGVLVRVVWRRRS